MALVTPLGEISVLVDGRRVPYSFVRLETDDNIFCVDGRYKIAIDFEPDGEKHLLSCCLNASCPVYREPESGERLECISFYSSDEKIKVSIGLKAGSEFFNDEAGNLVRVSGEFDYDTSYEVKENVFYSSYEILNITKTKLFVFGIAWATDSNKEKEFNTWISADPSMMGD